MSRRIQSVKSFIPALRWIIAGSLLVACLAIYIPSISSITSERQMRQVSPVGDSQLRVENNVLFIRDSEICRFIPVDGSRMTISLPSTNKFVNINGVDHITFVPIDKYINSFLIADIPVSLPLWNYVMEDSIDDEELSGTSIYLGGLSAERWDEFIKRLNVKTGRVFRLPTMYEWLYAARGGRLSQNYRYSGSDDLAEVAVFGEKEPDEYENYIAIGGIKKANELGLRDMSGSVWELTSTRLYEVDPFLTELYNSVKNKAVNPVEGDDGDLSKVETYERRVSMGGAAYSTSEKCAMDYLPYEINIYTGTRLVLVH